MQPQSLLPSDLLAAGICGRQRSGRGSPQESQIPASRGSGLTFQVCCNIKKKNRLLLKAFLCLLSSLVCHPKDSAELMFPFPQFSVWDDTAPAQLSPQQRGVRNCCPVFSASFLSVGRKQGCHAVCCYLKDMLRCFLSVVEKILSREPLYSSDISTLEKLTQFPQNNKRSTQRKQIPLGD